MQVIRHPELAGDGSDASIGYVDAGAGFSAVIAVRHDPPRIGTRTAPHRALRRGVVG